MKKLKIYIANVIVGAVLTVLFVVVSLDAISELVNQLGDFKGSYNLVEAVIYVLLFIPSNIYDYIPLSALVGCLIGLGMLASSSELVVMRASGVSIGQIVWAVFRPIFLFIFVGAILGEFVTPYLDQYADSRRALAQGHKRALQSEKGVWNREGDEYMHFNAVLPNGKLYGVTRYIFEGDKLISSSFSDSAIFQQDYWFEQDVRVTEFTDDGIVKKELSNRKWYTELSPELLNVLVLGQDELPIHRLYSYSAYLDKQGLDSSDYRLTFWQKSLQPLATLSLVMIAISFILGPLRQVTMGFRVFIGVIVGLLFQTSQKLLGPASLIFGFSPMFAVLIPILLCFFIGWFLVRRSQ